MPLAQAVGKSVPEQHQKMLGQVHDCVWPVKILNALNPHWQKRNAGKEKLSGGWFAERSFISRVYQWLLLVMRGLRLTAQQEE